MQKSPSSSLPGLGPDQRRFLDETLGEVGVTQVGENVFDFIPVAQSGDRKKMDEYRKRKSSGIRVEYGYAAEKYLNARFDDIEQQYAPPGIGKP